MGVADQFRIQFLTSLRLPRKALPASSGREDETNSIERIRVATPVAVHAGGPAVPAATAEKTVLTAIVPKKKIIKTRPQIFFPPAFGFRTAHVLILPNAVNFKIRVR